MIRNAGVPLLQALQRTDRISSGDIRIENAPLFNPLTSKVQPESVSLLDITELTRLPVVFSIGGRAQPIRITEIDWIAIGEPIEVGPPREPDRIFLGISPHLRIPQRPQRRKPFCFRSLPPTRSDS